MISNLARYLAISQILRKQQFPCYYSASIQNEAKSGKGDNTRKIRTVGNSKNKKLTKEIIFLLQIFLLHRILSKSSGRVV